MSTKRRKVSHEPGALKDVSIKAPKTKSKSQPAPKPKEPSPAPSSDAESETIDDAPAEEVEVAGPKSFADLVWELPFNYFQGTKTDRLARESSIHYAMPATGLVTKNRHPSRSSQSPPLCKAAT